MTQEEKELLLKDLCARLPYGIICKYWAKDYAKDCGDFINEDEGKIESISFTNREVVIGFTCVDLDTDIIKSYLRPMSSMTEEEKQEWYKQSHVDYDPEYKTDPTLSLDNCHLSIDWLNSHHFAHRTIDGKDMFELGLALDCTNLNIY